MKSLASNSSNLRVICLMGLLVGAGCGKKEARGTAPEAQPVPVTMGWTRVEPLARTIDVVGTLFGDEETTLSAKVPGRVVTIARDVGDRAEPGELLAEVDPVDYELALTQTRMALEQALAKVGLTSLPDETFDANTVPTAQQKRLESNNAEARFRRAEKLFQQSPPLISEQEFADQRTTFEVARSGYDVAVLEAGALLAEARAKQSDVALAEQRLKDTAIRAPGGQTSDVASMSNDTRSASASRQSEMTNPTSAPAPRFAVAAQLVSVGEYVSEGTPMFKLIADDPIKYRVSVPERFVGQIELDQQVAVAVESRAEPFFGRVARINPQIEQTTRSFLVEMLIQNEQGLLRPGSFARGAITTTTDMQVTFAPRQAIISFAGINKLFTAKDGKAVEARVETGVRRGEMIEVVSGLEGMHEIVLDGAAKLATGVPVEIKSTAEKPASRPATMEFQGAR